MTDNEMAALRLNEAVVARVAARLLDPIPANFAKLLSPKYFQLF